ncbi:hypothetical protein Tco_0333080 [Tanacetum coccineum]
MGIRQRDALPSPFMRLRLRRLVYRFPERPLWIADMCPQEIALTTLEGVNQRVIELATTVDQEDEIIYSQLDDARYNRALLRAQVNMLYRDRPFHRRTALLMDEETRLSHAAWARSMEACDQETVGDFRSAESRLSKTETVSGDTKDSEEPQDSDDRASETSWGPAKNPAEIAELPGAVGVGGVLVIGVFVWVVDDVLVFCVWVLGVWLGGVGCVFVRLIGFVGWFCGFRLCLVMDGDVGFDVLVVVVLGFLCWVLFLLGVFVVCDAVCDLLAVDRVFVCGCGVWVEVGLAVACCGKGNEIKKIEAELWNLKVKGTDVVAYNQRFQELALLSDRMFLKRLTKLKGELTLLLEQKGNKRKFEDTPRNNQNQQPNKRQNTGRAYAARNSDKKPPLQEGLTQWKNKNQGNGNGVARAYAVGVAGQNPDNNVVTGFEVYSKIDFGQLSPIEGSGNDISKTAFRNSIWTL